MMNQGSPSTVQMVRFGSGVCLENLLCPQISLAEGELWYGDVFLVWSGTLGDNSCKFNTNDYYTILDDSVLPTLRQFYGLVYYHEDNSHYHVAKFTIHWYEDNEVKRIVWPVQRPGQNPIKNLWGELIWNQSRNLPVFSKLNGKKIPTGCHTRTCRKHAQKGCGCNCFSWRFN